MKAQIINKFGDPSVFELSEVSKPDIKPGHALIKVYATSVNQIDCKIRSGAVSSVSPDFPAILQGDFAGIIDAVASDVTGFKVKEEDIEAYVTRLTDGKGFDIVFDTVGGPNLDKSLIAAAINGSVVTTAARSTHDLTPMHNKALSLHVVFMLIPLLKNQDRETHGKILAEIAKIVDEGKLKPLIDPHKFTLETVKDAHALLESGKAKGKVVISIG